MSKIAIVGIEGSGKTVLMTVLGERFQTPDPYGLFLSPETRETSDFHRVNLGKLENGEWPLETPHDSVRSLRWTLQRKDGNDDNEVLADLDFLDFAGEIYREAFDGGADGADRKWTEECETLRAHIRAADVLIVLVNLRNVVLRMTDERTNQVVWLSKGIVDYAKRDLKIPHVALAFTQVDAYRDVIDGAGGDLKSVLRKYLPDVSNIYSKLPLFALAAVDRTVLGADGLPRPASGFGSQGLDDLVHWILGCTEEDASGSGENAANGTQPHEQWRELVAGMEVLRADAALPEGLSMAERTARIDVLLILAERLASAVAGHGRSGVAAEDLAARRSELDGWKKFAELANGYVRAVVKKRADLISRLEADLSAPDAPLPYAVPRARMEARKVRFARRLRIALWFLLPLAFVAAVIYAFIFISDHNYIVDCEVRDGGYVCSSVFGIKFHEWQAGLKHPRDPHLVSGVEPETWRCIKVGYKWNSQRRGYEGVEPLELGDSTEIVLPGGAKMTFVWCCADRVHDFKMGSDSSEENRGTNETQHVVQLTRGFWIGRFEVTQGQWKSVMKGSRSDLANPSANKEGDDWPVENVSWDDCREFIAKINAEGKYWVSLPTEAQWEYACRWGTETPFSFGSALNGDLANCNGSCPYGTLIRGRNVGRTMRTGSFQPNDLGIFDMHGNVMEWCEDRYDEGFYKTDAARVDPCCATGERRVARGGGWNDPASGCRSAARHGFVPDARYGWLGFRLICTAGAF